MSVMENISVVLKRQYKFFSVHKGLVVMTNENNIIPINMNNDGGADKQDTLKVKESCIIRLIREHITDLVFGIVGAVISTVLIYFLVDVSHDLGSIQAQLGDVATRTELNAEIKSVRDSIDDLKLDYNSVEDKYQALYIYVLGSSARDPDSEYNEYIYDKGIFKDGHGDGYEEYGLSDLRINELLVDYKFMCDLNWWKPENN